MNRPINEDDVKRLIRKVKRDWMLCVCDEIRTALNAVEDGLLECKTVDAVSVIHAEWVLQKSPYAEHEEVYDGESHDRYVCSKCGHEAGYMCDPDGFADGQDLTPWCGECGALMDGEENATD